MSFGSHNNLMKRVALDDPQYYFNRHVQWLEFNRRVLEEARDVGNPLLERVKFLAITANNLDEFVEVRVASFLQRIESNRRSIARTPIRRSPARCWKQPTKKK
jgi:polyphosphate kinase